MARKGSLSRETIIQSMAEDLRELPYVHAFWEGGAAAFNRVDTWSDLDLYVVVDDSMVPATFEVVERSLTALSPIQIRHEVAWPAASGISQRFYRLERATEFLLIDLAVLKASAPDKFLVPQIHGDAVFLFNKQNAISIPSFDAEAFIRGLLDRRKRLVERMALFGPFVEKEILRGNHLEALEFYRALVLPSLVEALRMRHGPRHYDFRMRYVIGSLARISSGDWSASRSSRTRRTLKPNTATRSHGSGPRSKRSTRRKSDGSCPVPRND